MHSKKSRALIDQDRHRTMPSTEKSDLEKNDHVVEGHRTKPLLIVITLLEILSILILIKHREVIDNVHQMLNSILLGILTAGVAQSIIQLYRHVNYNRLLKFFVWGGINGVLSSLWIDTLVLQFEQTPYRIIADQVVGTPFFQSAFLIFNSVWENHDFYPAFASTFWRMLGTSYLVWPICSIISFNFLPTHLIFPFSCLVNVIWTLALGLIV